MTEPLLFKIKRFIRKICNKISGKNYGCCNKLFVNCKKCCNLCIYYDEHTNICSSKKCSGYGGYGYVTLSDRLFCKPYNPEREEIWNDN